LSIEGVKVKTALIMDNSPRRTILVVGAVLEQDGRIFIARRREEDSFGGLWEFPGGKVEPDESPEEALVRECREELEIEIEVGPVFEVTFYRYPKNNVLLLFYLGRILQGRLKARGCSGFAWVLREEFEHYEFLPADRPILEKLRNTPTPLWPLE
jgi:8-oxo-dGTP diphosphatase